MRVPLTPEKLAMANKHGVCIVPLKGKRKSLVEFLSAECRQAQQSEAAINETTLASCTEDASNYQAAEKDSKS